MPRRALGDGSSIECPACEHENDATDLSVDGCLVPGFELACNECGALFVIESVDWEPTVTVVEREGPQHPMRIP